MSDDLEIKIGKSTPGVTTLSKLAKDNKVDPVKNTRQGILNILDDSISDYSSIELTEAETVTLGKTLKRLSTGAASFALLHCTGADCPFASKCPLVAMPSKDRHGKAPVGMDCLLESTMLRETASAYLQEYQVDAINYTEVNIVTELAEIETLIWRINMQLSEAENSLLVIDQTIGFDRGTNLPIVQQQVSPLFEQKQKLAARKSKLVKLMVGDRQEKYKKEAALKQKPDADASSQMSDVKRQLEQLQQKINTAGGKIIDAEIMSPEKFMLQEGEGEKE